MANQDKIIKDLKKRNDKLNEQRMLAEVREYCSQRKCEELLKSIKRIEKHIQTIIGNSEGDQLVLAECDLIETEVQKCLNYGQGKEKHVETVDYVDSQMQDNSTTC